MRTPPYPRTGTSASAPARRAAALRTSVLALAAVALSAGVILPELEQRALQRRDALRLRDIETVRDAIERFHADRGRYPPAQECAAEGGWDVSYDGAFVPALIEAGYLPGRVADPLDDATHHYRYKVYPRGSFGCGGAGEFYVLGLKSYEGEFHAARRPGGFRCERRDWSGEMEYVTGGGILGG